MNLSNNYLAMSLKQETYYERPARHVTARNGPNGLNPYNAEGLGDRLYATLHKLPGKSATLFVYFWSRKTLPYIGLHLEATSYIPQQGQGLHIWTTSLSTTGCFKNKYTIQFLWMACLSRFATAILSGETVIALGTIRVNGKQLRVTDYVPRRALPCRPLVMGYSQLLSIKTIRAGPGRAVPCRAVPCRDVPCRPLVMCFLQGDQIGRYIALWAT